MCNSLLGFLFHFFAYTQLQITHDKFFWRNIYQMTIDTTLAKETGVFVIIIILLCIQDGELFGIDQTFRETPFTKKSPKGITCMPNDRSLDLPC